MRFLFWGAAGLIFYTYAGYVVLLWLRARLRPRPVLHGEFEPHVSIIMVVRNEEQVLEQKLGNLLSLDYPSGLLDIVVVSDGSSDRTEEILRDFSHNPRVQVLLKQISTGKAGGLNDAIQLARGEVIVFVDARQQIESTALLTLMRNFADPDVGCVSGALILGDPAADEMGKGMGLYWKIEKRIRGLESASGSMVGATGAIYAVRRELLSVIPEGTILDDVYIPMEVARQGKRVIFESQARAWDCADLGERREFSRKVRTLTGNYQLVQLAPWLLTSRNPLRFEFVSHKLLRLVVPFASAMLLISSLALSAPLYRFALISQLIFYGLGALGGLRLSRGPLAKLSNAALTVVILNTAAALAFVNFLTGRKAAWAR